MSLLIQQTPIVFTPLLAEIFGLREAILLQQIHYRCEMNGVESLEATYGYLSILVPDTQEPSIRRMCTSLAELGILHKESSGRLLSWSVNYDLIQEIESVIYHGSEGDQNDLLDRLRPDQKEHEKVFKMISYINNIRVRDNKEYKDKEKKKNNKEKCLCSVCSRAEEIVDTKGRCILCHFLAAWATYMPNKPQPKNTTETIRKRAKARLAMREDIIKAMRLATENPYLVSSSWFNLDYLLRNDTNAQKIIDGVFDFKNPNSSTANPGSRYN